MVFDVVTVAEGASRRRILALSQIAGSLTRSIVRGRQTRGDNYVARWNPDQVNWRPRDLFRDVLSRSTAAEVKVNPASLDSSTVRLAFQCLYRIQPSDPLSLS